MDGIPLLGNSHMRGVPPAQCGCGVTPDSTPGSPRLHHFWCCQVARAIVGQVEGRLGRPVNREHLWLVRAPDGVLPCVWDVVALAALSAMETGRRFLAARLREGSLESTRVEKAINRAVVDFWSRLHGFAALSITRKGWDLVGSFHPFL